MRDAYGERTCECLPFGGEAAAALSRVEDVHACKEHNFTTRRLAAQAIMHGHRDTARQGKRIR